MRFCVLAVCMGVFVANLSFAMAADSDNELEAELAALGLGEEFHKQAEQEVKEALDARGAGGAQGAIPKPTVTATVYKTDDMWEDEDDEPDYLAIRKMKDMFPKRGDAMRLNQKNFDEEVFSGDQDFTLIMFYSKWCKQCQFQAPSFRAAAKRFKNDKKIKIGAVNQEGNYDLSVRFDTEPNDPIIFYAHKNPEIDGDLKLYEGEVSFAALLQFIGSRGTEMIKVESYVRPLYPPGDTAVDLSLEWDNFNDTIFNKEKNVLVQFYAGWSEFCQVDAQNYTVIAARMGLKHPDTTVVAAIDVDKHERLADRYDIQGLPAYWLFNTSATKDTDAMKYTGDHNGAMVINEVEAFIASGGSKIPDGMKHEHPIHPKPWDEIVKDMNERQAKEDEKDAQERDEQIKRATERREKLLQKKAVKDAKKEKKEKATAKDDKKDDL